MILAGTGHRMQALGGFSLPNPTYIYVCQEIEKHLLELKPEKVLTGMAQGYDLWLAFVSNKLNIPFVACIPFEGQETRWPAETQKQYRSLRKKASEVIVVSEGGYAGWKMQKRNEYLIDNSTFLLSCYNFSGLGGTFNCLQYAEKIGRQSINIDPRLAV
jgi:uncharacterized phage-like protein YoqJ